MQVYLVAQPGSFSCSSSCEPLSVLGPHFCLLKINEYISLGYFELSLSEWKSSSLTSPASALFLFSVLKNNVTINNWKWKTLRHYAKCFMWILSRKPCNSLTKYLLNYPYFIDEKTEARGLSTLPKFRQLTVEFESRNFNSNTKSLKVSCHTWNLITFGLFIFLIPSLQSTAKFWPFYFCISISLIHPARLLHAVHTPSAVGWGAGVLEFSSDLGWDGVVISFFWV